MFSSFCTIKVESVSELQRTRLLPTLDTTIPSCLAEPGLWKAFNYSLKERRGERQAALCKPLNFLCQKPVVFIVGAGNVTRKSWDFDRFSFFFFLTTKTQGWWWQKSRRSQVLKPNCEIWYFHIYMGHILSYFKYKWQCIFLLVLLSAIRGGNVMSSLNLQNDYSGSNGKIKIMDVLIILKC